MVGWTQENCIEKERWGVRKKEKSRRENRTRKEMEGGGKEFSETPL